MWEGIFWIVTIMCLLKLGGELKNHWAEYLSKTDLIGSILVILLSGLVITTGYLIHTLIGYIKKT
jgi:hypothetical protein